MPAEVADETGAKRIERGHATIDVKIALFAGGEGEISGADGFLEQERLERGGGLMHAELWKLRGWKQALWRLSELVADLAVAQWQKAAEKHGGRIAFAGPHPAERLGFVTKEAGLGVVEPFDKKDDMAAGLVEHIARP